MPEEKNQKEPEKKKAEALTKKPKIAAILIRGLLGIKKPIKDTLAFLRLTHKNHCLILDNNPVNLGMLKKVKDYITWGEISPEISQELIKTRGQLYQGPETCSQGKIKYKKFFIHDNKKYKKHFPLNPPRKGFGRKGIKIPFKVGGALGYRGEKINDLIKRML